MKILGISAHYHDAAAALLVDGMPVAAVQEERLSRRKNDAAFPLAAIEWCLDQAGLEPDDLDAVVFYERPMLKFDRILTTALRAFPRSLARLPARHEELARREAVGARHHLAPSSACRAARSCSPSITSPMPPPPSSPRRRATPRSSPPTASANGRR